MPNKISDYWLERAKERLREDIRDTEEVIKLIDSAFEKALKTIEKEIASLFFKFSEDNELDYDLALKLLTGEELKDFRMTLKEYMELIDNPDILLELNTLSTRSRISRLERTMIEIQKSLDIAYTYQYEQIEDLMYRSTNSNYYKSIFDIGVAKNEIKEFNVLSKSDIVKEFSRPWSGKNFSQRLWKNRTLLREALEEEIIQSAIQGVNTQAATKRIMDKLNVTKKIASRLVHTEQTYFSSLGTKKAYAEMGVDKFIYIATLDVKTSEVCRDLDHEIFDVIDAQPGVNMPPMHPYCRSATAPYTGSLEGTRLARDIEGNNVKVDKNLSYREWYKKYVESNPKYVIEEKKWKSRHSDKKLHKKYIKAGVSVPKSLDKFQDIKYNEDNILWKDTKLRYEILKSYNLNIHEGRQGKHIKGHNNYNGKSYLLDSVDPQKLVKKYGGRGRFIRDKKGLWTNKEIVTSENYIGYYVEDGSLGDGVKTKKFSIHYSKTNGIHIVPREDD